MLMTTTETIPGRTLEPLGLVSGFGKGIQAALKMQTTLEKATTEAQAAMEQQAKKLGADAVVGIRMAFTAYGALALTGTAVHFAE